MLLLSQGLEPVVHSFRQSAVHALSNHSIHRTVKIPNGICVPASLFKGSNAAGVRPFGPRRSVFFMVDRTGQFSAITPQLARSCRDDLTPRQLAVVNATIFCHGQL